MSLFVRDAGGRRSLILSIGLAMGLYVGACSGEDGGRVVYFARRFCPGPLEVYDIQAGTTAVFKDEERSFHLGCFCSLLFFSGAQQREIN